MKPEERERVGQALLAAQASEEIAEALEIQRRGQQRRDLDAHDRLMASRAAEASRDVLHDSTPLKEPGSYTVYEARDRAAHTPPLARETER